MSILNIRPALNMIHMKLKCLCIAMETVTRVKRQASKWEENVTPLSTEQEIDIQNLGYRMGSNHPGIQSKTLSKKRKENKRASMSCHEEWLSPRKQITTNASEEGRMLTL